MTFQEVEPLLADVSEPQSRTVLGLLVATLLVLWGIFFHKLATDWSTNAQYEFGFFVPFLIVYLLWLRWQDRPSPSPEISTATILLTGALAAFSLLPIRLIQEANPDWRPLNWVHATVVVVLSLLPAGCAGGWPWIRHFAFPFFLIFLALPWPLVIEQTVVQTLARAVAAVTVELLSWPGIPALQRGNVIELATGPLGIADACTGVRSLAGTLMASVFFGEFYRLKWTRRLLLLAGGAVLAFLLNLCRTFFLSWRASAEGLEAVSKWHDSAGITIFVISFAALWMLALQMSRSHSASRSAGSARPALGIPPGILVGGLVWILLVQVVTESWYALRERHVSPAAAWVPKWPTESGRFYTSKVPDEARSILRYTEGTCGSLEWADGGLPWQVFYFRWAPGRTSSQLAVMHRPEICMPAAGAKLVAASEPLAVRVGEVTLPFEGTIFEDEGIRTYVFRCLWEDHSYRADQGVEMLDTSIKGRLKAAWLGRRNLGQRLFQVSIRAGNEQQAREELQRRITQLLVMT